MNTRNPEFYHSLHVRVGMGSNQPGFIYSEPRNIDIIHEDDLEEIVITPLATPRSSPIPTSRTPPIREAPRLQNNTRSQALHRSEESFWSTRVMIGNIKFPLSVFVILTSLLSLLAVGAIIVHDRYSNITCIGSYGGITFGYVKWLYIYAWTNIGLIGCIGWLDGISRISTIGVDNLKLNILRLGYIFQFAWYIIGSILYFIEINKSCSTDDILYDFGLVLFICQSIVWVTILFQDRTNNV